MNSVSAASWPTLTASLSPNMCCWSQSSNKRVAFVASTPDFTGQPGVANGASELFGAVFGEVGQHARSAVGVPVLPLDAPVEVELIVEV